MSKHFRYINIVNIYNKSILMEFNNLKDYKEDYKHNY